jgi:hypothetical protein
MADSAAIDAALIGQLLTDPTLGSLLPDGVFIDQANPGAERYVLITVTAAPDEGMFGGRAFESPVYLVLAVATSRSGANVSAAAARIDTLLDGVDLTPVGYAPTTFRRIRRWRRRDPDLQDASIKWDMRGGEYQAIVAAPL